MTVRTDERHGTHEHDGLTAWRRWRAARHSSLTGPEGVLTLVDTCWPETESRLPGLPGVWTVRGDQVWLTADAADEVRTAQGLAVLGETLVSAAPGASAPMLRFPGGSATVVVRDGRFGVRRFDPHAPAVAEFLDVETFGFDPTWRVPATFTPFRERTTVDYARMLESNPVTTEVAGELRFVLGGREHSTRPMFSEGSLLLVFADATTGVDTYRPGRFVRVRIPGGGPDTVPEGESVSVTVDFNRAYLPPCAFSPHYNCPLPPPDHRFDTAVRAGERQVRRRAGAAVD